MRLVVTDRFALLAGDNPQDSNTSYYSDNTTPINDRDDDDDDLDDLPELEEIGAPIEPALATATILEEGVFVSVSVPTGIIRVRVYPLAQARAEMLSASRLWRRLTDFDASGWQPNSDTIIRGRGGSNMAGGTRNLEVPSQQTLRSDRPWPWRGVVGAVLNPQGGN